MYNTSKPVSLFKKKKNLELVEDHAFLSMTRIFLLELHPAPRLTLL